MSLSIVRNDITKMSVDAIVNTANRHVGYARGTDSAVYHAAGIDQLMEARAKIGEMVPGQVAITEGFDLPATYIIHVVGTPWRGGEQGESDVIRTCYAKAMQCAWDMQCSTIAIPLLAAGSFGFPKTLALTLAMSEIRKFLAEHDMHVYLVVFDEEVVDITTDLFGELEEYIDSNYEAEEELIECSLSLELDAFDREEEDDILIGEADYLASPKPVVNNMPVKGINMSLEEQLFADMASEPETKVETTKKRHSIFGWKQRQAEKNEEQRRLEELKKLVSESFAARLQRLIDMRGLENPWVYTNAFMSKQTFNKIINAQSQPKKNTVLILAITLRLSLDETIDLLARAGHAFSPSSLSDTIIKFYIENGIYEWDDIDAAFMHFKLAPIVQ